MLQRTKYRRYACAGAAGAAASGWPEPPARQPSFFLRGGATGVAFIFFLKLQPLHHLPFFKFGSDRRFVGFFLLQTPFQPDTFSA